MTQRFLVSLAVIAIVFPLTLHAQEAVRAEIALNGASGNVEMPALPARITIEWNCTGADSARGNWTSRLLKPSGKQSGRLTKARAFAVLCEQNETGERAKAVVTVARTAPAPAPAGNVGARTATTTGSSTPTIHFSLPPVDMGGPLPSRLIIPIPKPDFTGEQMRVATPTPRLERFDPPFQYNPPALNQAASESGGKADIAVNLRAVGANSASTESAADRAITIPSGSSATLSWDASANAYACYLNGTWVKRDGSQSTGALTANKTYTLACNDYANAAKGSAAVTVKVAAPAAAPPSAAKLAVSCAANKTNAKVGEVVTWTATVSGGAGGYAYEWYVYNDTSSFAPSGAILRVAYKNAETADAAVKVTSGSEAVTSDTCAPSVKIEASTINTLTEPTPPPPPTPPPTTVINPPPPNQPPVIASWSCPSSVAAYTSATCAVSASDPDGATLTARVNWSDGAAEEATTLSASSAGASANASFSHEYKTGNYSFNARVTVTDVSGASAYRDSVISVTTGGAASSSGDAGGASATPAPANLVLSSPSVTGEAASDGRLYAGQTLITVGIGNNGGTTGSGAVQFQYSTNNSNFYDWLPGGSFSVAPGGSHSASASWGAGTGIYYFRARVGENYSPSVRVEFAAKTSSAAVFQFANVLDAVRALVQQLRIY